MSISRRKRVLIITYYWPPAGGPGVQRVLKFVKYLPQFGWDPVVLTVENGEYPAIDKSLLNEIPEGIKVYKVSTIEPFTIYKRLTGKERNEPISSFELVESEPSIFRRVSHALRHNLFIPDARVGFYLKNKKLARAIFEEFLPEVVLTSGPPHSIHLFGRHLKRKYSVSWFCDFRDPWTQAFWETGAARLSFVQSRLESMERSVLSESDKTIAVSQGVLGSLNIESDKSIIIPNGYDPDDFNTTYKRAGQFRMTFIGGLGATQICDDYFRAVSAIPRAEHHLIDVQFIGKIHPLIKERVEEYNLSDIVKILPYQPHDEVIERIVNTELLLLFVAREVGNGVLSGKLFEYLATKNEILAVSNKNNTDLRDVISECKAGVVFDYEESMTEYLLDRFDHWKRGEKSNADIEMVQRYSRIVQTELLANSMRENIDE